MSKAIARSWTFCLRRFEHTLRCMITAFWTLEGKYRNYVGAPPKEHMGRIYVG